MSPSLSTVFCYATSPAAPTYAFLVNFIWLKNTHKRVKGALGARNDCVPWVTHGRKPAVRGQQHEREGHGRPGSQQTWRQCGQTSALKGTCVRACVYSTQSHRKLEDGTVMSLSTSHVLPLNWSQSTDRAIADRSPSSPAGSQGGRSMLPWLSLLAGS